MIDLTEPLVSVLMTAYNREKYIAEAIESVLNSTYKNFELIIVDDDSKDRTVEIAKSYAILDRRIKVYENKNNLGDYPNRNKAASYASGKYLKYVDSDDMVYPETIEHMVNEMENYPDAGFGFSSKYDVSSVLHTPREVYYSHFFERGILDLGPIGIIYHREKFEEVGRFKILRNVSDLDLSLRMAAKYPVVEMKPGLVFWREHEEQEIRIDPEKYIEHGLQIILNALNQADCPLQEAEKAIIIKKFRRQYAINIIKNVVKTRKIRKYFSYWNKNQLNILDLFLI